MSNESNIFIEYYPIATPIDSICAIVRVFQQKNPTNYNLHLREIVPPGLSTYRNFPNHISHNLIYNSYRPYGTSIIILRLIG